MKLVCLYVFLALYLQCSLCNKGKDFRGLLKEIRELIDRKDGIEDPKKNTIDGTSNNPFKPDVIVREQGRDRAAESDGSNVVQVQTDAGVSGSPDGYGRSGMVVEHNGGTETKAIYSNNDPLNNIGEFDEVYETSLNDKREKRNLLQLSSLWPKGIVPYTIDGEKINITRYGGTIQKAIDVMTNLTCVQLKPLTSELSKELGHNNSVKFSVNRGCTSYVGMTKPEQYISLEPDCMYVSVVLHEILHAIGFIHEQDRSDRDDYIRMLSSWSQKTPHQSINYAPYDLQSVMHYSLQVGGEVVMDVLDQNQKFLIWSRKPETLQFYDIQDVNGMYDCTASCTTSTECQHGGFLYHKCQCFCPDYLTGSSCENVITDGDCGGIFDVAIGQEVQIKTPNYPSPYPVNKTCRWLFRGKEGYHLRITIDDLQLPFNNLDRCYHWIDIQYNNLGHPGILRCGEAAGLTYTTSRDSPTLMMVGFDSKTSPTWTPKRGFSYRVYLVSTECLNDPCNFGTCTTTGSGYNCVCESGFSGQHCDQMQGGSIFSCDFDFGKPCLFVNTAHMDQFDWTLNMFESFYKEIGPNYARTGHGYLMADMSSERIPNDVAHFSTAFPLTAEDRCLSFFYNMNGQHASTLKVKAKSSQSSSFNTVWFKHGNQGPNWHYAEVFLSSEENLELLFEAIKGSNSSIIALDNITLSPGPCEFNNISDTLHITTVSSRRHDLKEYGMTFDDIGWINFEVQGCSMVVVELFTETKSTDNYYKLALGVSGTWAYLHKYENNKKTMNLYNLDDFASCDGYQSYWLGWKNNKLQAGRGFVYGENVVMSGDDADPYDIKHVEVNSHSRAKWVFIKGNCVSGFGKCEDTGYCVIPEEVCNNINNCADGSDEKDCVFPACDVSEFRCTYGRCYPGTKKCDGIKDCSDNSDELDCPIIVKPHSRVNLTEYGLHPLSSSNFKFTVQTCSDAWITLWSGGSMLYQVGIGRGGNAWSTLDKIGGSSDVHIGAQVNCAFFLPFYINWSGSVVQVGRGHDLGQNVFLEIQDSFTYQIDEISVGSYGKEVFYNIEAALSPCTSTQFRCGYGRCINMTGRCDGVPHCTDGFDEKDCPILVEKWKQDVISNHKYNITGLDWMNFEVQSCADAFVTLLQGDEEVFNVKLGRGGNTWNSLFNYLTDQSVHKNNRPVLDCSNFKAFWFSWGDGIVKVGEGLYKGNNPLFELPYDSPVSIDDVQLKSYANDNIFRVRQGNCFEGFFKCLETEECIPLDMKCDGVSDCAASGGSDEQNCEYPQCDADTEFRCGYGRCYPIEKKCNEEVDCRDETDELKCKIKTAPYTSVKISERGFTVEGQTWINFKVKTCADAHVLLANDDQVIYKIFLGRGGDSWSSIQKGSDPMKYKNGNILNCTEFLPFWVSWEGGEVRVGMGLNRFGKVFLSLADDSNEIVNEVKVKSYAMEGEWLIEQAKMIVVPSLWLSSYIDLEPYDITGQNRDTLIFTTDACYDVWIGLMPDKFNMSSMYKIGIGRGGNAFHSITKDGTERKVAYSTLLRCEATPIWITWKNGRIAAGNGTDVTMNVAIEWTDGEPLVIKDIGLSSWNEIWTFQIIDPLYA